MQKVTVFLRFKFHEPEVVIWQHDKTAVVHLDAKGLRLRVLAPAERVRLRHVGITILGMTSFHTLMSMEWVC